MPALLIDLREILAIAVGLIGVSLIAYAKWHRKTKPSYLDRILLGAGVFILVTAVYVMEPEILYWLGVTEADKIGIHVIDGIWWVGLAFFLTKIIDFIIWRGMLTHDGELLIPRMLVHLTNFLVAFVVFILFLYFGLGKDVTGLVAASGVIVVGIGYLAKAPFESAIAGVALNLAPMFRKGDRVAIYPKDINKEFMGTVQDIGWMHVTIKDKEGHLEHVQNLLVEQSAVINFSQPSQRPCYTTEVTLEYEVPMQKGYQAINDAMRDMSETVATFSVKAERFGRFGITYLVRFWISDRHDYYEVTHQINSAIYYKIQKIMKWDFGYDKFNSMNAAQVTDKATSIHQSTATALSLTPPQRASLLRRVEILASLTENEIRDLAENSSPRVFGPPELIIRQGEVGDSMFVVIEGRARVYLRPEGHETIELTVNGPGSYFGEMALLTGQPRGAFVRAIDDVVLLEIPKAGLSKILKNRPAIAGEIATAVADRQAMNEALLSAASAKNKTVAHNKTLAEAIRLKVHHFFGLDGQHGSTH